MKTKFLKISQLVALATTVAAVFFSSCSRYTFVPDGFIVNGDPTYYNNEKKISLGLFGDHLNYKDKEGVGFRTNKLYKGDKKILKKIQLLPDNVEILFSGIPIYEPFYNVLAAINKDGQKVNLDSSFRTKFENDTLAYYYKTFLLKDKRIYYSIIPYNGMQLSFVYYQNRNDSCTYCDIDQLSLLNSKRVRKQHLYSPGSSQCDCDAGNNVKSVKITIPEKEILSDGKALIKVYDPANTRLKCFKILEKGTSGTDFQLCKGKYTVLYSDFDNNLKWKKELIVD